MTVKLIKGAGSDYLKRLAATGKKSVKIGWFKSAIYPEETDAHGNKTGGQQVAYIAAIQEYGWPRRGIPARSFMRPTNKTERKHWAELSKKLVKQIQEGRLTENAALEILGLDAQGAIRRTISKIWSPPLSERTIKMRLQKLKDGKTIGNLTKPLIETGYLYESISYTTGEV